MAHNMKELDKQVGLEMAWHRLTEVVPMVSLDNSGHAFEVVERPLFFEDGERADGYRALVASDKGNIFQVARESYRVVQNSRMWEIMVNSMNGTPYTIESAGSVGNRSKFYISTSLKEAKEKIINGDKFANYLNFQWSHDGSLGLTLADSSIRIVCQNTLNVSLSAAKTRVDRAGKQKAGSEGISCYIKHTKNAETRIEDFEKILEQIFADREVVFAQIGRLGEQSLTSADAEKLFAGFLATGPKEELTTRKTNQIERLGSLFSDRSRGNRGQTLYDAFNAATDYFSHESSGGEDSLKQFASSEFGMGRNRKVQFLNVCLDKERVKETQRLGETVLKN